MVIRVLPNSYATLERELISMNIVIEHWENKGLPCSESSIQAFKEFYPDYMKRYSNMYLSKGEQQTLTKEKNRLKKKCYLYTRHMLMNLNMAIERGELEKSERIRYGLTLEQQRMPEMRRILKIAQWADFVITGEESRIADGGKPFANPSAKDLQAVLDEYNSLIKKNSDAKIAYDKAQQALEDVLKKGISIIKDLWDEIEFFYRKETAPSRRRNARIFGVNYVIVDNKSNSSK